MVGRIVWWNSEKTQGVIQVVDEHGVVSKYFLPESKVVQRPQQIKAGYFVKFSDALQAKRQDLLPVAINVTVSEFPFAEHAGANTLAVKSVSGVRE